MSIDRARARELADAKLDTVRREGLDLVFVDDETVEVEEGWIFEWGDRRAIAGDDDDALGGGGPIFVARSGELVHMVWSGESWETALTRYRETGSMRETWRTD